MFGGIFIEFLLGDLGSGSCMRLAPCSAMGILRGDPVSSFLFVDI